MPPQTFGPNGQASAPDVECTLLRRADRLLSLFVLRGHLLAVLAHLLRHRLGAHGLVSGRLAAARELGHHLLAVLAHLLNHAALDHRPQRQRGADGQHADDELLHRCFPPSAPIAVSAWSLCAPPDSAVLSTSISRRAR